MVARCSKTLFFFFNDTATTEIYTLSLHDALPISESDREGLGITHLLEGSIQFIRGRSEEHTSELQSLRHLVCRLLLGKKTPVYFLQDLLYVSLYCLKNSTEYDQAIHHILVYSDLL